MWLLRFLFAPELGRALADIGGASRRFGRSVRALSDGMSSGERSWRRLLERERRARTILGAALASAGLGLVALGAAGLAAGSAHAQTIDPEIFATKDNATRDLLAFLSDVGVGRNDPQLRHLDHAWASTVHAFQGRTVDNVIAAMEADHPHLTTQKSFYVEISRARDRAELVTDDAERLRERLETATGERISALEGIAPVVREAPEKDAESTQEAARAAPERVTEPARETDRSAAAGKAVEQEDGSRVSKDRQQAGREREKRIEIELELEL